MFNFLLLSIFIFSFKIYFCLNIDSKIQFLQQQQQQNHHQHHHNQIYDEQIENSIILPNYKKFLTPISDKNHILLENSVFKTKIDEISEIFRINIENIKEKNKRNDVIFLIDSSSSIGKQNFYSEIKFVKKLLSDFNVSYNYTRIALITFSSQAKIVRHVDQISNHSESHDKCSLLNNEIPKINFAGGGTFTYGALKEAEEIFKNSRLNSKKYIFLVTDGFSNGKDPIPAAIDLKKQNISIFTIGIQSGNIIELYNISSTPKNHYHFLLDSFPQFEGLARRALRADYKVGQSVILKNASRCNILCEHENNVNKLDSCCDVNADCACGTSSGHYACICHPGYYGSGKIDQCYACPNGTYWHISKMCRPCPDINHITLKQPALNISYCVCKAGWRKAGDYKCEGITCPKLSPPENGYFVKQSTTCANVLNSACGVRCKSGYQLLGTSLRICQENGTWSGIEATCSLKLCPSLPVPYYGLIVCRNRDLDLFFDYSPRNTTFMETYEDVTKRNTEPMPIDTECTYKCGPGYYLVGSRVRNCLPLSKWDGLQTTCKQVLCPPLPKPIYGEYELSDCTEMKVPHGTNCTIICPKGFNIEGPETKSCTGKKIGIWTYKNKIPKCVDTTPPEITCPENMTLIATEDFVIVKSLPPPLHLSDSSDMNVSFWTQPIINESNGIELKIGEHIFSYSASDMFNNKAECIFKISIVDKTPPIVENCVNPEEFYVTVTNNLTSSEIIIWDEPIFYDNSNLEINVTRSLDPGYLNIGFYQVTYIATDAFNNSNQCILNITVKERTCGTLLSPLNGQSLCAKNSTHTWCEINCNDGFAIFNYQDETFLENFRLTCINDSPKWKYETIPDCTPIDLPNSIEQLLTISVDSDDKFCSDSNAREKLQKNLGDNLRKHLCNELNDCNIISEIPECTENNEINDIVEKNYYNIVKREINEENSYKNNNNRNKTKATVRIKLLTKVGKRLGIWKKNLTLSENVRTVKNELQILNENEDLQTKLKQMRIDVKKLKIEELVRCSDGSVSKKQLCVQCPRGTYQDAALNRCQPCPIGTYNDKFGQITCNKCPLHYSTKKFGRQKFEECKQVCPPGTIAKTKTPRKNVRPESINIKSLMPFCQKCGIGEYQPYYDQTNCLPCPIDYLSVRGSQSLNDCHRKEIIHPCQSNTQICGSFGYCIPNQTGNNLFTCVCQQGYYGAKCEFQINLCLSAPCYNNGMCYHVNQTSIGCYCPPQFTGKYCEELKISCRNVMCRNGGSCVETIDGAICECPLGFDGDFCENEMNYCSYSPCESGNCVNTIDGYYCECPPGIMGKRCHLHPCDYLPCHKNAICIDLPHYPATKDSFMCKCPKGLKGHDCTQIDNPCDAQPCKNNAQCSPQAVRQIGGNSSIIEDLNSFDEEIYEKYTCTCLPYFYGDKCEIFTTPDFIMEFPKSGVTSFVELDGPIESLTEISFCFWIKTNDNFNYGSILSYATENVDNMFTFTDYNGFVLYVHGNHTVTDMVVNDGIWHFICASWMSENGYYEIYLDGILQHTGSNLSSGEMVENKGTFIIGQEQDQLGGSFSETESFVGSIAYFDIWDSFITGIQVQEYYRTCEPYQGTLYSWSDFKSKIHGDVKIKTSEFCHACPMNLSLSHGYVRIVGNYAYYQCETGYILKGNPVRTCLRTSEWTQNYPYCKIVDCRKPPSIDNGFMEYSHTIYNSEVRYECDPGFRLKGYSIQKCQENGNWSASVPQCISTVKCNRFEEYPQMTIYYTNYRKMLNPNLTSYPVGTFAEILCGHGDEAIETTLICQPNGYWDDVLPDPCFALKVENSKNNVTSELPNVSQFRSTTSFSVYQAETKTENPTTISQTKRIMTVTRTTPSLSQPYRTTQSPTSTVRPNFSRIIKTTTRVEPISTVGNTKSTEAFFTTLPTTNIMSYQTPSSSSSPINVPEISRTPTSIEQFSFPDNKIEPDKHFWINLKNYLFTGCSSKISGTSLFCKYYKNSSNYQHFTDLVNFEPPEDIEYQNIDSKLFEYLSKNENIFLQKNEIPFEEFFNIALYGESHPIHSKLINSQLENSLRFALCIYIDAIIWDDENFEKSLFEQNHENLLLAKKLKNLIIKIAIPVYIDFQKRYKTNVEKDYEFSSFTESIFENLEDNTYCILQNAPNIPRNSFIVGIKSPNGDFYDFPVLDNEDGAYMVETKTKIIYNCTKNYESQNEIYSECRKDEIWSQIDNYCELKWCDDPPKISNMFYLNNEDSNVDEKFEIGRKLQLQCYDGYVMHGNSEIVCLKTGRWTRVLARCSRISCNKPKLPDKAKIIRGRSYLFEDRIRIECIDNGNQIEITCGKNGTWIPMKIC